MEVQIHRSQRGSYKSDLILSGVKRHNKDARKNMRKLMPLGGWKIETQKIYVNECQSKAWPDDGGANFSAKQANGQW